MGDVVITLCRKFEDGLCNGKFVQRPEGSPGVINHAAIWDRDVPDRKKPCKGPEADTRLPC